MRQLSHIIKQHSNLPSFDVTLTDEYSNPIDLTNALSIVFRMQLVGDSAVVRTGICDSPSLGSGMVEYEFTDADTQISGSYLANVLVTFPGGKLQTFPFNDYYLIDIQQDLDDDIDDVEYDLVFATPAQARALGYEVSERDLLRAQGIIEANCGRMIEQVQEAMDNDSISRYDIVRLKKATVYQAVWMQANMDAEERIDATTLRTAGLSGESAVLSADAVILAPIARRLLVGLSWARSRSIRTSNGSNNSGFSQTRVKGSGWKPL